ncbi:MAG: hypothetical protein NC095_11525 [Muribaculum sp.]|nr:hypothetical protein [Muribaculum sp.]
MKTAKTIILLSTFLALAGAWMFGSCCHDSSDVRATTINETGTVSLVDTDTLPTVRSFSRRYTFRGYDRYDVVDMVLSKDGKEILDIGEWEVNHMRSSFSEMIKRLPSGWNDTVTVLCVSEVEETANLNFLIWNRTDSIHVLDYPMDGAVEKHIETIWPMDMERMVKMDQKWLEYVGNLAIDTPVHTVFRIIQESDSVLYIEGRSFYWHSPHEVQSLRTPPGLLAE